MKPRPSIKKITEANPFKPIYKKSSLEQTYSKKIIIGESSPEPPEKTHSKKIITEATIGATDDQPNRSIDPPYQTHHQPIPTHRSKPSSLIHADPTSKIQNPGDGDEASETREQMEKQRRKREKRTEKMREMRNRGERVRDKILGMAIYIRSAGI